MMQEQTIILNNTNSFNPVHIFECGQCFRWNNQKDNSYIGVVGNNVLKVQKEENKIKSPYTVERKREKVYQNFIYIAIVVLLITIGVLLYTILHEDKNEDNLVYGGNYELTK